MKTIIAFFASRRYWNDEYELQVAYDKLKLDMKVFSENSVLITDEKDFNKLSKGDCVIIVPMSGAVQKEAVIVASMYKTVIMYAAYIKGNVQVNIAEKMVQNNAAPTVMDSWAVLRRTHKHVSIALNRSEILKNMKVFNAFNKINGSKILLVGDTEPWVISNSSSLKTYEKLGVEIQQIQQEEIAQLYRTLSDKDGEMYYQYFKGDAKSIMEPKEEDIRASCRMAAALVKIIEKYDSDGMALACFNLLKEGTNSCIGVSYINDCTEYFAACEGDLDSAVTMLIMKHLTKTKLWMANPGLHPNGIINFSHCTAPLNIDGSGKCPYILRSHHESGIGTSLQVEYPLNRLVTACRISDEVGKITIHQGITVQGQYECACRTQVYVKMDDFSKYVSSALGCHQVFAFEDITEELDMLAKQLKLERV